MATPIGNLRDITLRALDVLAAADVVACEDTRVTRRLLGRYGIATPLVSYHDHNAERVRPRLMERLESGDIVALCSDAGTPLVNDPGYRLVVDAIDRGVAVHALPGPSAPINALVLAGLPTDRFLYLGFLPPRSKARREALVRFRDLDASLVVLESAPRLAAALDDMARVLGPRPAVVAREITKAFEEVRRSTLDALADHYRHAGPPKGEVTVVVGPPAAEAGEDAAADLDALLQAALGEGSLRDAVDRVAAATGLARRRVYDRALALRKAGG